MLSLEPFLASWFALMGAVVGSFLNVVVYRLPRGYALNIPSRSMCTSCNKQLQWFENIPLLSFIIQRGKCSKCGAAIGARYFLIELITSALFYAVYSHFGFTFNSLFYCAFVASLMAVTFIDIDFRIIPDEISIWGTVLALAASHWVEGLGLTAALIGAASASFLFWLMGFVYEKITGREGLGFGDVKLLAFIGASLGAKGAFGTVIVSSFVGSVFGIILMISQKKNLKMAVPYGPFLAIGALLFLFWGDSILLSVYSF